MSRFHPTILLIACVLPSSACNTVDDARAGAGPASDVPVRWTLGSRPLLEIGVVEGEEPYQLHDVRAATLMDDGRIAIANQGSHQIRIFDDAGAFMLASGREGDGPGDWQLLTTIEQVRGDTLAVYDRWLRRLGLVDAATGEYLGEPDPERAAKIRPPTVLYGGLMVEGVPAGRLDVIEPVVRNLDLLSPQMPWRVRVDPDGTVFVLYARAGSTPDVVGIYDLDGRHRADLVLPSGFVPLDFTADRLVGVARDSLHVEYVQVWALDRHAAPASEAPTLAAALEAAGGAAAAGNAAATVYSGADRDRAFPLAVSLAKNMMSRQEIHYSTNATYSADLDALEFETDEAGAVEGVVVQILEAGPLAHISRYILPDSAAGCLSGAGYVNLPDDVTPGVVTCWKR